MDSVVLPLKDFAKNSVRLVKRCTKPDRRGEVSSDDTAGLLHYFLCPDKSSHAEFNKICSRTALGFIVMGFIGFFVKLIFIVRPALRLLCRLSAVSSSVMGTLAEGFGAAAANKPDHRGRHSELTR